MAHPVSSFPLGEDPDLEMPEAQQDQFPQEAQAAQAHQLQVQAKQAQATQQAIAAQAAQMAQQMFQQHLHSSKLL